MIEHTFAPDFEKDHAFEYVFTDPKASPFQSPVKPLKDYEISTAPRRSLGRRPVTLVAARREFYNVMSNASKVAEFDVVIPVLQPVTLTVFRQLAFREGLSEEARASIQAAFDAYKWPDDGEPNVFAWKNMGEKGSSDEFRVVYSYELVKDGAVAELTEERDALLSLYSAKWKDGRLPVLGPEKRIDTYFSEQRFQIVRVREEQLAGRPPETPAVTDHYFEHEKGKPDKEGKDIDDYIREALLEDMKSFPDCQGIADVPVRERIAELLRWPEIKIEWYEAEIEIGCIRVVVTLPRILTRIGMKVLWAVVGKSKNLDKLVVSQITDCAIKAAIAGAVVGVFLSSIEAAVSAFNARFNDCVYYNAAKIVTCLFPDLILETEYEADWA